PRRDRSPHRRESPPDPARRAEAAEQVDEEQREEQRPDEAGLDDGCHVVRVRPPACPPGHELEVDRERVQPEPEQRVRVQRLGDEVVYLEVKRGRRVARLQAGVEDVLEVREPARDDDAAPPVIGFRTSASRLCPATLAASWSTPYAAFAANPAQNHPTVRQ